jgi:N-acetylglucosamine kinase-like BadF-type ATPase
MVVERSMVDYYLGVDGGNSKTHVLVITCQGKPVGFGASGGSDFQEVGIEAAQREWQTAIDKALSCANLERQQISLACFCLAGADLPEDYVLLQEAVAKMASPMPIVVKNDTIAALRAGLHRLPFGVTVVVGVGFNAAGRGKDGHEIILPGLGYISGDYGGGRWLGRQIIRAVIRAWDGRGPATCLSQLILDAMGVSNEMELIQRLRYEDRARQDVIDLVPTLFDAAYNGDKVAQGLLIRLGTEVGITANTLIKKLGLQCEEVPVVLSTGVFRGKGPLLIDVVAMVVHRVAPQAKVIVPDFLPVVGAALEALDEGGIHTSAELVDNLREGLASDYPDLLSN